MIPAFSFSVSAPGKIILHGEHSVVHGKKAIACAIGARVKIDAATHPEKSSALIITMPAMNLHKFPIDCSDLDVITASCNDHEDVVTAIENKCRMILIDQSISNFTEVAISCILYAYCKAFCGKKTENPSISISVNSEIPVGAGLGSSAAFNTSIACMFLLLSSSIELPQHCEKFSKLTKEEDLDAINALAYQMEKIVHKSPSGIDNAIATFGGAAVFQNGNIKHVEKMPILQLLIVNSNIPRSTKTLVSKVHQYLSMHPSIVSPILDSMDAIASAAELILEKLHDNIYNQEILSDWGRLIETNQCLLAALGVSHSVLDKICTISAKYKCPAKLTGAGGGGCAIIFLDMLKDDVESISQMEKELVSEGYQCFNASIGGNGVLVKGL